MILSGVDVYCGQWKLPPPAGRLSITLAHHIWLLDSDENHIFWRPALGEGLLSFIVLPGDRRFPSCSDAVLTLLQKDAYARAAALLQIPEAGL